MMIVGRQKILTSRKSEGLESDPYWRNAVMSSFPKELLHQRFKRGPDPAQGPKLEFGNVASHQRLIAAGIR
jgi:hypothetical protein